MPASRSSTPTTRLCSEAVQHSRRSGSTAAFRSPRRAPRPARRFGRANRPSRPSAARSSKSLPGSPLPQPARTNACCASTGRAGGRAAERATAIAMVSPLPRGYDELRARGSRLISLQLGIDAALRAVLPVAAGRREVDELRGEHGRRGGGEAPRRRRRRVLSADGTVLEGPGHERLVARGIDTFDAVPRSRHPRRRDPLAGAALRRRARLR